MVRRLSPKEFDAGSNPAAHANNAKVSGGKGMDRPSRIREQLGMSHGAAANRLRKNIMFSLLSRLGDNICHVCKLSIDSSEDLSVEHKSPWENRDESLFWDIDNIAFSHKKCNRPHFRNGPTWDDREHPTRRCKDKSLFWCWKCRLCLPSDMFTKNKSSHNGLEGVCQSCRKLVR